MVSLVENLWICVRCSASQRGFVGAVHFSGAPAGMFVKSFVLKSNVNILQSFRYIQIYSNHSALRFRSIEFICQHFFNTSRQLLF